MKKFGLRFHHLGLATDNFNLTLKVLKKLKYKVKSIKTNKHFNVKNAICTSSYMPNIEIVSKTKNKSPIDKIIKKNKQLVYHICYISRNISQTLKLFKKHQIHIIKVSDSYLSPFEGITSSFFFIRGIGLVEIMDESQKKEINKKLVLIFRKNLRLNKSFNSKKILKLKLGSDIDSLSLISIVAEINQKFKVKFSADQISKIRSTSDIFKFVFKFFKINA